MTTSMRCVTVLAGLLILGLPVSAQAQLFRTFVSAAFGNDANNCDRPTPCRTFQGAHDKTSDGGEIAVIDPGGYGSLTITKTISIVNDGVGEASILVSGGVVGLTMNGAADGSVNLRGITIQGIGFGGGTGLRFNSGFALTIENSVIRNHTGNGVEFQPNANATLALSNTLLADNGGVGLRVLPSGSGTVGVSLSRVEAYHNSFGGFNVFGTGSTGTINATAAECTAANNGGSGFAVISTAGHAVTNLMVVRSAAANNGTGLVATGGATATLRVGQSAVAGNATSWSASSGAILRSYGDNKIDGNGDGDPAPLTIAKK
jgi:Right handed beta helix region